MASKRSESLEIISVEEITIGRCTGAQRYNPDGFTRHVTVTDNHTNGTREVECSCLKAGFCMPYDNQSSIEQTLPCVLLVDPATRA